MTSNTGKFLYFAFGSNLLAERIHIKNPSAVFRSVGKVKGYKLDFGYFSQRWQGGAATITEDPDSTVYGIIWELDQEHQETLDKQESVPTVYRRIQVEATNEKSETFVCVSYQLLDKHSANIPSKIYKKVIIQGAKQNGLPKEYITYLENIPDNGYDKNLEEMLTQVGQVDLKLQ